jgi:uncharacterized membrane protein
MKLAVPILVLALCYVFFFSYVIASYSELPARVASHFDINGQPNSWMSRDTCVGFTLGLGIILPAVIIGLMAGAEKIPVSFINLPHRDYWLAPERRKQALAILLQFSLWFAAMNVLFLTGIHWLIVQANATNAERHLNGVSLILVAGAFLIGTLIWIRLLVQRFANLG